MMNPNLPAETLTVSLKQKSRSKWVAQFAKAQILKRLSLLRTGKLVLLDGDEKHSFGNDMNPPRISTAVTARLESQA